MNYNIQRQKKLQGYLIPLARRDLMRYIHTSEADQYRQKLIDLEQENQERQMASIDMTARIREYQEGFVYGG